MKKFSYSIDEEHFVGQFASAEEAAETGFEDNPDYDSLWIGTNCIVEAKDFINPFFILENIASNAEDMVGDAAEDWLYELMSNKEKCSDLKLLIAKWIDQNDPVKFWTVDNVVKVERNEVLK